MLPDKALLTATSSLNVKDGLHLNKPPPPRRHDRSVDFQPERYWPPTIVFDMIDEEDRGVVWFSVDEYDIIKARNSLIVEIMKTGRFQESTEHTFRGLEHKLKEGYLRRRTHKFNGLNAVLAEQGRQYAQGVTHPDVIAEKYRRVAVTAKETAYVAGQQDFENSYCCSTAYNTRDATTINNETDLTREGTRSWDDSDSDRENKFPRPWYEVPNADDTIAS